MGQIPDKEYKCMTCDKVTTYSFSRYCGCYVCDVCGDHYGLARCYCGWSTTSPGNGYNELREMGEYIDPEDYY